MQQPYAFGGQFACEKCVREYYMNIWLVLDWKDDPRFEEEVKSELQSRATLANRILKRKG
jgi:hypothetical protein